MFCKLVYFQALAYFSQWSVHPRRVSVACPFRDRVALKCSNDTAANKVRIVGRGALVWCRPIKRLDFLSGGGWWGRGRGRASPLISLRLMISRVAHVCSAFGPSAFGPCDAVSERASLLFAGLARTKQTQISSLYLSASCPFSEVNELQRLTCPVCSAGDICVERTLQQMHPKFCPKPIPHQKTMQLIPCIIIIFG